MDAAASIIAVVELAAKVASLCFQYSRSVKNAPSEIARLQHEVQILTVTLEAAQKLLGSKDGPKLFASMQLSSACTESFARLDALAKRLNPSMTRKTMSRFGIRAIKWPFESGEVERTIREIERCNQAISLALQSDQTTLLLDINKMQEVSLDLQVDQGKQLIDIGQKLDLGKLPIAEGAAFDSHHDELDARCHPETRTELRRQIHNWANNPREKCIFWLNGMAGTGKSTISRTVAQTFANSGQLAASFFFKRGEGDRGNASRLFTTLAVQLAQRIPGILEHIQAVVESEPEISGKTLKEQFEKLNLLPLSKIQRSPSGPLVYVIVIDALDECDNEMHTRTVINLFSRVESLNIRLFVTSRPELPIRLGFHDISGTYQHLILHEVPKPAIEHDIAVFFRHELTKIRDEHNTLLPTDCALPTDWPGEINLRILVEMAIPLFIFAATVSRFIGDQYRDPEKQLAMVLMYQTAGQVSKMDKTYLPILNQLLNDSDTETDRVNLVSRFHAIVGTIILLADPLPVAALARFLHTPKREILTILNSLHAVLSIPNDASPVRLLHLSFRDFLLDDQTREKSPFWIDEASRHDAITKNCIELMSQHLHQNMCNLKYPGMSRYEIDAKVFSDRLPPDLRYACCHWVYHLEQRGRPITDGDEVHLFLQKHFLHWLETLSLTGKSSESAALVSILQSRVGVAQGNEISEFLQDARRFILHGFVSIDEAPLQVYCSALTFAPSRSIIRRTFIDHLPSWISHFPIVPVTWGQLEQVLKVHSQNITSIALSEDGNRFAFAFSSDEVQVWNFVTGQVEHSINMNIYSYMNGKFGLITRGEAIKSLAFVNKGTKVVIVIEDTGIWEWDLTTDQTEQMLTDYVDDFSYKICRPVISPDGRKLVSISEDYKVRVRHVPTGRLELELTLAPGIPRFSFSYDGNRLAIGSNTEKIEIWDLSIGQTAQSCESRPSPDIIAFSPDGTRLAGHGLRDGSEVFVSDVATGRILNILQSPSGRPKYLVFSPDGRKLACTLSDGSACVWDVSSGFTTWVLDRADLWATCLTFSLDNRLVTGSSDGIVRAWDISVDEDLGVPECHSSGVANVTFSPDGTLVASTDHHTVKLWDVTSTPARKRMEDDHSSSALFSSDRKLVCISPKLDVRITDIESGQLERQYEVNLKDSSKPDLRRIDSSSTKMAARLPDGSVRIWDLMSGSEGQVLKGVDRAPQGTMTLSADSTLIATIARSNKVQLWNAETGEAQQALVHPVRVHHARLSRDGTMLASSDSWTLWLWATATGRVEHSLDTENEVMNIAFSPDGTRVAAVFLDQHVRVWNVVSGAAEEIGPHSSWIRDAFPSESIVLPGNYSLDQMRQWVCWNGRRVLRLPVDLELQSVQWRGHTIAIGGAGGRVAILAFEDAFAEV